MELVFVIAAAVVAWVAGAFWYNLLAAPWARVTGLQVDNRGRPESKSALPYLASGACLLVVAVFMRALFLYAGIAGLLTGLGIGAGLGALIVLPFTVMHNLYPGRPVTLSLIDGGYAVIACALMGVILGAL